MSTELNMKSVLLGLSLWTLYNISMIIKAITKTRLREKRDFRVFPFMRINQFFLE